MILSVLCTFFSTLCCDSWSS